MNSGRANTRDTPANVTPPSPPVKALMITRAMGNAKNPTKKRATTISRARNSRSDALAAERLRETICIARPARYAAASLNSAKMLSRLMDSLMTPSRAESGSSSNSRRGFITNVRASATRCF